MALSKPPSEPSPQIQRELTLGSGHTSNRNSTRPSHSPNGEQRNGGTFRGRFHRFHVGVCGWISNSYDMVRRNWFRQSLNEPDDLDLPPPPLDGPDLPRPYVNRPARRRPPPPDYQPPDPFEMQILGQPRQRQGGNQGGNPPGRHGSWDSIGAAITRGLSWAETNPKWSSIIIWTIIIGLVGGAVGGWAIKENGGEKENGWNHLRDVHGSLDEILANGWHGLQSEQTLLGSVKGNYSICDNLPTVLQTISNGPFSPDGCKLMWPWRENYCFWLSSFDSVTVVTDDTELAKSLLLIPRMRCAPQGETAGRKEDTSNRDSKSCFVVTVIPDDSQVEQFGFLVTRFQATGNPRVKMNGLIAGTMSTNTSYIQTMVDSGRDWVDGPDGDFRGLFITRYDIPVVKFAAPRGMNIASLTPSLLFSDKLQKEEGKASKLHHSQAVLAVMVYNWLRVAA
ncbi:hypothetical protein ACJZ2D_003860 [Fusarium nematophilum]